jgi:hypothetical protein
MGSSEYGARSPLGARKPGGGRTPTRPSVNPDGSMVEGPIATVEGAGLLRPCLGADGPRSWSPSTTRTRHSHTSLSARDHRQRWARCLSEYAGTRRSTRWRLDGAKAQDRFDRLERGPYGTRRGQFVPGRVPPPGGRRAPSSHLSCSRAGESGPCQSRHPVLQPVRRPPLGSVAFLCARSKQATFAARPSSGTDLDEHLDRTRRRRVLTRHWRPGCSPPEALAGFQSSWTSRRRVPYPGANTARRRGRRSAFVQLGPDHARPVSIRPISGVLAIVQAAAAVRGTDPAIAATTGAGSESPNDLQLSTGGHDRLGIHGRVNRGSRGRLVVSDAGPAGQRGSPEAGRRVRLELACPWIVAPGPGLARFRPPRARPSIGNACPRHRTVAIVARILNPPPMRWQHWP